MAAETHTPPSESADPLTRLKRILWNTPQARFFNANPQDLTEALDTVERIMTEDYPAIVRDGQSLVERVHALESERATVRAFFGVTE